MIEESTQPLMRIIALVLICAGWQYAYNEQWNEPHTLVDVLIHEGRHNGQ